MPLISIDELQAPEAHNDISNELLTDFPSIISSSSLATIRKCAQRGAYESIQNLRPLSPNPHFHAGKALAHGLYTARRDYMVNGFDPRTAEARGLRAMCNKWGETHVNYHDDKNLSNTMAAYAVYLKQWPLDEDPFHLHGDMNEFSIACPMNVMHPVTHEPLIYSGRFDTVGEMRGLQLIEDDKSTARFDADWWKRWPLRGQFKGYNYLARRVANMPINGMLVRGVLINQSQCRTMEHVVLYQDWELDEWWSQVNDEVSLFVQQFLRDRFNNAMGDSPCTEYGGCPYFDLCNTRPDLRQQMFHNYRREAYNPLGTDNGAEDDV